MLAGDYYFLFHFWIFFSQSHQSQDDNSSRIVEISDEEAERILEEEKEKSQKKEEKEKSKEVSKPDEKADEDESEEDKGIRIAFVYQNLKKCCMLL